LLAAIACLVGGAWGFYRARSQPRALLALLIGVSLAFLVVSAGKWWLVPMQNWDGWLVDHPARIERWYEALSALVTLAWMWALLLAPAAWRPFIEVDSPPVNSKPGAA
jgi:hypothetical protein